jgi:hypothetical protein
MKKKRARSMMKNMMKKKIGRDIAASTYEAPEFERERRRNFKRDFLNGILS